MKHIKVFAPGTVANLGCGFDIMGLTLDGVGDRIEVAAEAGASGLAIRNESGKRLPEKPEDNVITPAVAALLEAYGKPVRVEITILEKIAPGSGIGSSAASSAAAVYGLNELLGRPFSAERLVEFAMMGEALIGGTPHADNVGPALLGGVALIRRSMHDVVAEPYRKGFIPGYDRLKEEVLSEGALAMNIAGSGPSVFALAAEGSVSERVAERMKSHFAGLGIGCNIYAGRVSNRGARIEE